MATKDELIKFIAEINEAKNRSFGPLKDYVRDNYLNVHPKDLSIGRLRQIKSNISTWTRKLEDVFGDNPEAIDCRDYLQEIMEDITLRIESKQSNTLSAKHKPKCNTLRDTSKALKDIFVNNDAYGDIMRMLSDQEITDKDTGSWINRAKGCKNRIIALIHHLGSKGYYSNSTPSVPDAETIQSIALETFGVKISKETIKSANRDGNNISELRARHFSFIKAYNPDKIH